MVEHQELLDLPHDLSPSSKTVVPFLARDGLVAGPFHGTPRVDERKGYGPSERPRDREDRSAREPLGFVGTLDTTTSLLGLDPACIVGTCSPCLFGKSSSDTA